MNVLRCVSLYFYDDLIRPSPIEIMSRLVYNMLIVWDNYW